ncbi:MAG: hypothetical protein J0H57_00830, partial [Rhodospirillales bacterium]|nr:hypothetical protein [Rhodospirillales bacterium]
TIAYADVPRSDMSAATSFYTTFQQMSLTLGIALSAAALAGSVALTGHAEPHLGDFSAAFLFVAAVSMMAPLLASRLDPSAGAELSGHRDTPGEAKAELSAAPAAVAPAAVALPVGALPPSNGTEGAAQR